MHSHKGGGDRGDGIVSLGGWVKRGRDQADYRHRSRTNGCNYSICCCVREYVLSWHVVPGEGRGGEQEDTCRHKDMV